jgi:hypothetical protein
MRRFLLAALLCWAAPLAAETPGHLHVAHLFGVGVDNVGAEFSPLYSNVPGALSLRYWSSERLGWDGLLALLVQTNPESLDAKGGLAPATDTFVGGGVGARFNAFRPSDFLLVQVTARVSFAQAIHSVGGPNSLMLQASSLNCWLGSGFECFLPPWPALSVEGSVGLVLARLAGGSDLAGVPSVNSSSFSDSGKGFIPAQVGIHYYF